MKISDILNEKIVYRDRLHKIIIAINPSKNEWESNFPNGAAFVLLKNGTIAIGDGSMLEHYSICKYAGLDIKTEIARGQIYDGKIIIELWDELDKIGILHPNFNPEIDKMNDNVKNDIEKYTQFPKGKRQTFAKLVKDATQKFVPNWKICIQLKSGSGGFDWFEEEY